MSGDIGRVPDGTGLSPPAEPASQSHRLRRFDPSREEMDAWLTVNCGSGVPFFGEAKTQTDALHGLAYVQRQILATNTYRPLIGQSNAAASALQWALDHFAREALGAPQADVIRLVVAARAVAFEQVSPEAIRELDQASEAFASRVPWGDEPSDSDGPK